MNDWERRAYHLADELSIERRRTNRWINVCGVLAVLLVIAVAVAVVQGLYG